MSNLSQFGTVGLVKHVVLFPEQNIEENVSLLKHNMLRIMLHIIIIQPFVTFSFGV
jgi:hypothetical protein